MQRNLKSTQIERARQIQASTKMLSSTRDSENSEAARQQSAAAVASRKRDVQSTPQGGVLANVNSATEANSASQAGTGVGVDDGESRQNNENVYIQRAPLLDRTNNIFGQSRVQSLTTPVSSMQPNLSTQNGGLPLRNSVNNTTNQKSHVGHQAVTPASPLAERKTPLVLRSANRLGPLSVATHPTQVPKPENATFASRASSTGRLSVSFAISPSGSMLDSSPAQGARSMATTGNTSWYTMPSSSAHNNTDADAFGENIYQDEGDTILHSQDQHRAELATLQMALKDALEENHRVHLLATRTLTENAELKSQLRHLATISMLYDAAKTELDTVYATKCSCKCSCLAKEKST